MSDDLVKKEPDKDIVVSRKNWIDSLKDNSNTVYSRLTDDEKKVVDKAYRKWKDGFYSSVPMICQNDNCPAPFRMSCPYHQLGKAPTNEQCPVELDLMINHIEKYAEEFNLNPELHSELILLTELAECIIYEDRATKILAAPDANQFLLVEDRFTNAGDVYTQTGLHPVMIVKDKMKARRMKILESLLGTRKEKARVIKTIMNNGSGYTGRIVDLKAKIDALNEKMNNKDNELEVKEE